MAQYFLFPEKDATIYGHPTRHDLNTGRDEILEISDELNTTNDLYHPSRTLIKFKDTEIQNVITEVMATNTFSASLQFYATEHRNLASTQVIDVALISGSWDGGTGKYLNDPSSSNGVSWNYRDNSTTATRWTTSSFGVGVTGSYVTGSPGGGAWYTGSGYLVSSSYTLVDSLDLNIDVTSLVQKVSASLLASEAYPTGVVNQGFIVKRRNSQEFGTSTEGLMNFFGLETHTIFPPSLVFKWDDSSYSTGSVGSVLDSGDLFVKANNNKLEYYEAEEYTFRLNVRERFPARTFVTSSNYLNVNYFTSESYYSVRDAATDIDVIPFDESFTKLSADSNGMYFKMWMNGLQPERYYKILVKHKNNDGITIYDPDITFKVVK